MEILKHVGKIKGTEEKLAVIFNEVPNEPNNCLVVMTNTLGDIDHRELMLSIESQEGQASVNLGEMMNSRMNEAGRPLLTSLHESKKITKVATDTVILTPNPKSEIILSEMNDMLRGQARSRGEDDFIGDADLASSAGSTTSVKVDPVNNLSNKQAPVQAAEPLTIVDEAEEANVSDGLLSNEALAQSLINQSNTMRSESDRLMEEAVALNPTLAPAKKAKSKVTKTATKKDTATTK